MVCMTLGHRMNRTSDYTERKALTEKFYTYRGIVLRSLNDQLNLRDTCTSDVVLAGVLTLLLVDVSPFPAFKVATQSRPPY